MIFSSRYPPLIDDELRATLVWSKRTSIDRFRITSWCHCPQVGVDSTVRHQVQLRIEQLSIQFIARQAAPTAFPRTPSTVSAFCISHTSRFGDVRSPVPPRPVNGVTVSVAGRDSRDYYRHSVTMGPRAR